MDGASLNSSEKPDRIRICQKSDDFVGTLITVNQRGGIYLFVFYVAHETIAHSDNPILDLLIGGFGNNLP